MKTPALGRLYFICALVIVLACSLVWKLHDLTVTRRTFLQNESIKRSSRTLKIKANRGIVFDRNGVPLVNNKVLYSLWIDPTKINFLNSHLKSLENILSVRPDVVKKKLNTQKHFVYLKRSLDLQQVADLKKANIPGLNFQKEYARNYIYGDSLSSILGKVNVDNVGLDGIELMYDSSLKPIQGIKKVTIDVFGHVLSVDQIIQAERSGKDISLTIDKDMQLILHHKLHEYASKVKAQAARALLVHIPSGEIYAMANYLNQDELDERSYIRNFSFTDLFEPGSTFKPIFMSTILEAGFDDSTVVKTAGQRLKVGNLTIKDVSRSDELNLTGILMKSSNVGMAKLALQLDGSKVLDILQKFGIESPSYIGFPGEASGHIPKDLARNKVSLAASSFGYGVKLTLVELIRCYAILANHGKWVDIHLIKNFRNVKNKTVIPAKDADAIISMLHQVVEKGTARKARVKGLKVAGKTGTTHLVLDGQYNKKRYQSSFVGLAPYPNPKFILALQINDPKGKSYYGGDVVAPIFADTIKYILTKDKLNSLGDNQHVQ